MKDTRELRAFLVKQMTEIADGNMDLNHAKGVSNMAQQIYNTLNIEVKMAIARSKLGDTAVEPVAFGDGGEDSDGDQ